jgi:hypothetical protein
VRLRPAADYRDRAAYVPCANFGYASGTAGDGNGDGYSDIVIGGPFNDLKDLAPGRGYWINATAGCVWVLP